MVIYRKRGSVARWENGIAIAVTESVVAVEQGDLFECYPDHQTQQPPPLEKVSAIAHEITASVGRDVTIERLIVMEGSAEHEIGDRNWADRSRRIHLSLVRDRFRALINLGSWSLDEISSVAKALARVTEERSPPARMCLARGVTAAVLPMLAGTTPPNVALVQTGGGLDGNGGTIEEVPIEREPWPNWYRPSYRLRPVRMPLNLRLECDITDIDSDAPRAIALLAPASSVVLRLLVVDGDFAYPVTARIDQIESVGSERVWYPYGAGSFGAEMMLLSAAHSTGRAGMS